MSKADLQDFPRPVVLFPVPPSPGKSRIKFHDVASFPGTLEPCRGLKTEGLAGYAQFGNPPQNDNGKNNLTPHDYNGHNFNDFTSDNDFGLHNP